MSEVRRPEKFVIMLMTPRTGKVGISRQREVALFGFTLS